MFWYTFCLRTFRRILIFVFALFALLWSTVLESDADLLPIFFSTDLVAQNQVKFGPRSFQTAEVSSRYYALKAKVQYTEEATGGPKEFYVAGLRKFRAGDEVHSVISRKNAQKAKGLLVSDFSQSTSRIRGKNMTVAKMKQGEKIVSMDIMMDETRREEMSN